MRWCLCPSLRRSTATNLNEKGVLIGEIQRLLGHSDYQQTLAYIDIRPERRAEMFTLAF
ncbi:tyrosine-type recombinase/integrase [Photobacterium sp. OFAV2-7]|uniref:tyrosine-type recombinase/integrase n=1 Tax=Photobacterium sp. OFAV2-7 TaxID=2917748 RepID=UPI00351CD6D9